MRIRSEIALGLLILTVLYMVCKIVRQMLLTAGLDLICPNCGASFTKPSTPRRFRDLPYRIFFMRPYRCVTCERRFFAFPPREEKGRLLRTATAQNVGAPSRNGG